MTQLNKELAFVKYESIDDIIASSGLETHTHMIREAYRLGYMHGSVRKAGNEQLVLGYMRKYERDNGFGPTLKEIAVWMGSKSITTVQRALTSLEKQGLVVRDKYMKRAWKITQLTNPSVKEV